MTLPLVLPPLELASWQPTRDLLWRYARCLSSVRRALSPPARHWSHISLAVGTRGLTTGPMIVPGGRFEMILDIRRAQIVLEAETGRAWAGGVPGTASAEILERVQGWMARSGGESLTLRDEPPEIGDGSAYDQAAADRYWTALSGIEAILARFAGGLRGEARGPQLWPHHFDLAVLWLTGRQAPGVDPNDEEAADESMNFGFSTGDEGVANPYFYATAYPRLDEQLEVPPGAERQAAGWQGVRLDYDQLASSNEPGDALLAFLTRVQMSGKKALEGRAAGT
jgi:hypothetical protein